MTTLDPIFQPVEWEAIDAALYDWVNLLTGCEVLWSDQNEIQQAYPYLTLKRAPAVRTGGKPELRSNFDDTQPLGEEVEFVATSQMEFTLNVQAFTDEAAGANDPQVNAFQLAGLLHASLGLLTTQAALREVGLAVIEELPIIDLSEVVNGRWLNRTSFDVRFRVASVMSERTGYVDKVQFSSSSLGIDDTTADAS